MRFRNSLSPALFALLCVVTSASADEAKLVVNPDTLYFRQMGAAPPPPLRIAVSARGGTLGSYTAAAATTSGGNWLSVSPAGGTGPGTLTVTANTANLAAGEYTGAITITASGFTNSPFRVKVVLQLMTRKPGGDDLESGLVVRPDELEFHVTQNGAAPKALPVVVMNPTAANFSWTATAAVSTPAGGKWLKVSPTAGTGSAVLQVEVDPTGLAGGEYKGTITVTSGSNSAKVEVELEVGAARAAKLVIAPRAFNFIVEPNATKPLEPKTLEVKNEGAATFNWTATAKVDTPAGGKWLSITPTSGSGAGKITVKADPTGLPEGMYSGKITVASGAESAEAQVFLRVLGPSKPRAQVTPRALNFAAGQGKVSPDSRTLKIGSKGTGLKFTATATTAKGGDWLKITPSSGSVPGSITVSINSAVALALAPGVYTGNIEVKIAGAAQEVNNVLVALKVFGTGETPRLEVEPGGLAFTATAGGSNPQAKKLKLEAEGAASIAWTASVSVTSPSGGNWLSITPTSGTAPGEVSVSANIAGLAAGTYAGSVVFTPAASSGAPPVTVRVTLVVSPAAEPTAFQPSDGRTREAVSGPLVAIVTEPANGFLSQVDLPLNVSVTVLDSTGAPVEGATVLLLSSRNEPVLALADLGGGEYSGVFRALSSGPLTLTGSAQLESLVSPSFAVSGDLESANPTVIYQDGAVSAASYAAAPTPLAPGSLLSVFGLGIAGSGGAASSIPLPFSLGGVSLTIGGVPAPLVVAIAGAQDQVNVQVPFELQGVAQADVLVNNNGVLSVPETIALGPAVPALFTFSQTGSGPGAILHANFSALSAGSPAVAGEVVLLYATGLGAVDPAVSTGRATSGLTRVTGNVQVTIGGVPAEVQYAGLAPGFVGLYQINVKLPAGVPSGDALVVLSVDGTPATGRATMAVR